MVNLFVITMLCKDDTILLVRRCNTTFGSGLYSLVGGKVEAGERALHAIAREVQEETTLVIPESAFQLVHTFNRKGPDAELIALVFKADITHMHAPVNNEPEKHDDMRFFTLTQLPNNILPAHKNALECIQSNIRYSEHGW